LGCSQQIDLVGGHLWRNPMKRDSFLNVVQKHVRTGTKLCKDLKVSLADRKRIFVSLE